MGVRYARELKKRGKLDSPADRSAAVLGIAKRLGTGREPIARGVVQVVGTGGVDPKTYKYLRRNYGLSPKRRNPLGWLGDLGI